MKLKGGGKSECGVVLVDRVRLREGGKIVFELLGGELELQVNLCRSQASKVVMAWVRERFAGQQVMDVFSEDK